jgi:hypothetical protein
VVLVILTPFPPPPPAVARSLELLAVLRRGDPKEMHAAGDLTDLPRPWEPSSCPAELREHVWTWCEEVSRWLNHQYAWRPAQLIPPCWPRHAHIARELAVLAVLRWDAEQAATPAVVEDWHRYTWPMFSDRMFTRLGESTCRTGKHQDWPAAGRIDAYASRDATEERQDLFKADVHPVSGDD